MLAATLRFFSICGDGGRVDFFRPPLPFFMGSIVPSGAMIGCFAFTFFFPFLVFIELGADCINFGGGKGLMKGLVAAFCNFTGDTFE